MCFLYALQRSMYDVVAIQYGSYALYILFGNRFFIPPL